MPPSTSNNKNKLNLNSSSAFSSNNNNSSSQFNNNSSSKNKNSFLPQGQKTKFQSQDSDGSDISYQSSIQSQEDMNIGRVQFFKQQMSRFFINYPELINHDIIQNQTFDQENIASYMQGSNFNNNNGIKKNNFNSNNKQTKNNFNKNWQTIADQILNQAKQSTSFLQDLSRRIALYRSKIQQQDLIDLLLKQQKNIMKQIDLQINQKKKQVKGNNKNTQNIQGVQNMYFSWRKKKQIQNRLNLVKDDQVSIRKHSQNIDNNKSINSPKKSDRNINNNSRNKHRSLHKANQDSLSKRNQKNISSHIKQNNSKLSAFFITQGGNYQQKETLSNANQSGFNQNSVKKGTNDKQIKLNRINSQRQSIQDKSLSKVTKNNNTGNFLIDSIKQNKDIDSSTILQKQSRTNQGQIFWKHLVNFEPKTQAGRQLCELIRKNNNPNDQLGIKKTIMNFLSRSKDMVQNQIVLKSTISQKIQKLYNDDSKQLLMFYPTRMCAAANNTNSSQNGSSNTSSKQGGSSANGGSFNSNVKDEIIDNSNNKYFGKEVSGTGQSHKMFEQGEKFMKVLEDIVQGPLMKYWMSIQQNKL